MVRSEPEVVVQMGLLTAVVTVQQPAPVVRDLLSAVVVVAVVTLTVAVVVGVASV